MNNKRTAAVLDRLVAAGLASRGWRVDCDLCATQEFEEISAAKSVARCHGCGAHARYAPGAHGEPGLYYKLNALLHRVSLNGGLAILAATALLQQEGGYLLPGVNIMLNGEAHGDLDILGWRSSLLFAGEAKMTAGGFANQDHQRDVQKSKDVGADQHLVMCLEDLPQSIQDEIQGHCNVAEIEMRLLAGVSTLS